MSMGDPRGASDDDAMRGPGFPVETDGATWGQASIVLMRGAVLALAVALVAGAIGVLYYIPGVPDRLREAGFAFKTLRPVHTSFVMAWIFLGGVAVVHRYFEDHSELIDAGGRARLRAQVWLWVLAGVGSLVTIAMGITSGREYLGFHPVFSIPMLAGWLLFAFTFFKMTGRGFLDRPVYVTMWGVGVLFFVYTFVEQHAWLLPEVFTHPLTDLRLQWKATGTLIGSFNLFVYGSLIYVGERLSGDTRYAHSRLAYALFAVGVLNSFTNYGHHTYHLPQSHTVKWISFVVSMTEIVILTRVVWDIAASVGRRAGAGFACTRCLLTATKWWTAAMLASAILLSIPPINTIVHGTHVVTGHAMGTEIGIDTMALLAALTWLLESRRTRSADSQTTRRDIVTRRWIIAMNIAAAALVTWLHVSGTVVGVTRYIGTTPPEWFGSLSVAMFVTAGLCTGGAMLALLLRWSPELFAPARALTRP